MDTIKTFPVLDIPVHLSDDYGEKLGECIEQNRGAHVVTFNAEMAIMCQKDPELSQIIARADLVVPDGAGIIFYLRRRGIKQRRCAGIELAASLLERIGVREKKFLICFYGGAPGIARKAAENWHSKIPRLSIMTNHGFLSESEYQQWCDALQARQPQLILVGLGVPRQEYWIDRHRHLCPHAVWIGVGGSFDIWAAAKTRAPKFFRDFHLEWLYRLYQEPWRWRRMLALPKFFWRALFE